MIKKWLFDRKFKRLLSVRKPVKVDRVNTVDSVTILCSDDECKPEDLLKAAGFFQSMEISTRAYLITGKKNHPPFYGIEIIGPENCHWNNVPLESALVGWLEQKPDFLLVLNKNNNPTISYLVAASNSKLIAAVDGDIREKPIVQILLDPAECSGRPLREVSKLVYDILLKVGMKTPILG